MIVKRTTFVSGKDLPGCPMLTYLGDAGAGWQLGSGTHTHSYTNTHTHTDEKFDAQKYTHTHTHTSFAHVAQTLSQEHDETEQQCTKPVFQRYRNNIILTHTSTRRLQA